jgi:hypothetical protein
LHPETSGLGGWGGVKPTVKEGGIGFSLYLEKKGSKIYSQTPKVAATDPQISVERKKILKFTNFCLKIQLKCYIYMYIFYVLYFEGMLNSTNN